MARRSQGLPQYQIVPMRASPTLHTAPPIDPPPAAHFTPPHRRPLAEPNCLASGLLFSCISIFFASKAYY